MFGFGVPELLLILVIGLVVFGPGKLPEIGKALGRSIQEFKSAGKDGDMKNITPSEGANGEREGERETLRERAKEKGVGDGKDTNA